MQQSLNKILSNPLINIVKLPSLSPPAAGADTTLDIPRGPLYKRLWIKYTGVTLAQLTNIEVRQNGTVFQSYRTGTELNNVNQYYGHAAATGWLAIDFDDRDSFTLGGLDQYGWQTNAAASRFATGQLKISIASGATNPALEVYAEQAQTNDLKPRRVRTFYRYDYNSQQIGDYDIADMPKGGQYDQLARVWFFNGFITNMRLKLNQVETYDLPAGLNPIVSALNGRTQPSGTFVFDPSAISSRRTGAFLDTTGINDFRFIATLSASGSIPVSAEYRQILD